MAPFPDLWRLFSLVADPVRGSSFSVSATAFRSTATSLSHILLFAPPVPLIFPRGVRLCHQLIYGRRPSFALR